MMLPPDLPHDLHAQAQAVVACAPTTARVVLFADMTQRATAARLYVLDLSDRTRPLLVLRTQVAHGYGSDPTRSGYATRFGHVDGSGMTSLGLYRVGAPYVGKHGHSYHLDGLQASNANAAARAIELHPAAYVSTQGVGRSAGCAAVAPSIIPALDRRYGSLTGAVLWIAGPGATLPTCAALGSPWQAQAPDWVQGVNACLAA